MARISAASRDPMPVSRKFARVRVISTGQRGRVDLGQLSGRIGVSETGKGRPLALVPSSDQGLLTLRSGVAGLLPIEDTSSLLDVGGQMTTTCSRSTTPGRPRARHG